MASIPSVRDEIERKMEECGELYAPSDIPLPQPSGHKGWVVLANTPGELKNTLGIPGSSTMFREALGSLMYHYMRIVRCHIGGKRHYKLLVR